MKDFYYILGIDSNCTAGEVKEAYKKLAKKFHPDLNQGDEYFENRFREINEAYEILNDPVKRFQYDKNLKKLRSKDSPNQYNQARLSTEGKLKTKNFGTIFTITLILVGLILGVYIVESLISSKKAAGKKDVIVRVAAIKIRKHHKLKHNAKSLNDSDYLGPKGDSTRRIQIKPAPVIKQVPVINKTIDDNQVNFLYATYVRANATGVINMRQSDNFNSEIIETIPANSKVFVLARGNFYYLVLFESYTGYVPKWSLEMK